MDGNDRDRELTEEELQPEIEETETTEPAEESAKEFHYDGELDSIKLFNRYSDEPYAVLEYNAADIYIWEYLDNIETELQRIDAAKNMNGRQKLKAMGKVYADNFDAIFGEGTARLVSRYDTSGLKFQAYKDVISVLNTAMEQHYAEAEAEAKKERTKALLEAKQHGGNFRATQA